MKTDHLGDPDVEGRIILRYICRKSDEKIMEWIGPA
jgi:hypothetical protein